MSNSHEIHPWMYVQQANQVIDTSSRSYSRFRSLSTKGQGETTWNNHWVLIERQWLWNMTVRMAGLVTIGPSRYSLHRYMYSRFRGISAWGEGSRARRHDIRHKISRPTCEEAFHLARYATVWVSFWWAVPSCSTNLHLLDLASHHSPWPACPGKLILSDPALQHVNRFKPLD